jgi:LysR family transcriptional regulator (chromosome initiation inhibitor)
VQSLGVMRYVPVAVPVAEVPSLAWNRDNALQDMLVRKVFRRDIAAAALRPDGGGLRGCGVRCVRLGNVPDSLAAPRLRDGSFVRVADEHLDVPLYWQCWKLDNPIVEKITGSVGSAADVILRKPH